jgi:hypothetical protein
MRDGIWYDKPPGIQASSVQVVQFVLIFEKKGCSIKSKINSDGIAMKPYIGSLKSLNLLVSSLWDIWMSGKLCLINGKIN